MNVTLTLNNIKCHGCANSIASKLDQMDGISDTSVNVDLGQVSFNSEDESIIENARQKLAKMGYPEGDPSAIQTAKSYVSCMIGRVK